MCRAGVKSIWRKKSPAVQSFLSSVVILGLNKRVRVAICAWQNKRLAPLLLFRPVKTKGMTRFIVTKVERDLQPKTFKMDRAVLDAKKE